MSIKDNLHDRLHSTQWGANLIGWWNGVMATLRWVLGDEEKDNLDT